MKVNKKIVLVTIAIILFSIPSLIYGKNESYNQTLSQPFNQTELQEPQKQPLENTTSSEPQAKPVNITKEIIDKALANENSQWESIIKLSDNIGYGEVLDTYCYWVNTSKSHLIYTSAIVEVDIPIVGEKTKANTIEIVYEGGSVGRHTHVVHYTPPRPTTTQKEAKIIFYTLTHPDKESVLAIRTIEKPTKNGSTEETTLDLGILSYTFTPDPPYINETQRTGFEYHYYNGDHPNYDHETRYGGAFFNPAGMPITYETNLNCPDQTPAITDTQCRTAIQNAFQTWENIGTAEVDFTWTMDSSGDVSDDIYNVVLWKDLDFGGAACYSYYLSDNSDALTGFDVAMNTDLEWSIGSTHTDIQAVCTHEIGHAIGLNDLIWDPDDDEVMWYSYGGVADRTLKPGDIAGVTYLYPDDDVPVISFNDPSQSDHFDHSIYIEVSVTCSDAISSVEYMLSSVKGPEYLESWQSMTPSGGVYNATAQITSSDWEPGEYWITVRAKTDQDIYGYEWLTVDYEGWRQDRLYRKSITITGSTEGAQEDYTIPVKVYYGSGTDGTVTDGPLTLGKVYTSSNCQTDFDDIVFTDSDGWTLLDSWREEYTTSGSAIFWVKVPSIPASPNTIDIYIYYGNGAVTIDSEGYNTFYRFYDFEDTPYGTQPYGWENINQEAGDTFITIRKADYPNYVKEGDQAAKLHEGGGSEHAKFACEEFDTPDGFVAHFWFRFETGQRRTMLGLLNINDDTTTSVLCRDDASDWRRTVYSSGFSDLSWGNPSPDVWYRVELYRRDSDGKINYWLDRTYEDGWYTPRSTTDTRKLFVRGRYQLPTDAYFDVCYIRKFANPEPVVSSIGAQ